MHKLFKDVKKILIESMNKIIYISVEVYLKIKLFEKKRNDV
jgi:hypothetical protein